MMKWFTLTEKCQTIKLYLMKHIKTSLIKIKIQIKFNFS